MVQPLFSAMTPSMTLEAFLGSAMASDRAELVQSQVVPKMAPKRFHAKTQKALLQLLDPWAEGRGHFYPEWSVVLSRRGEAWVPVPDLMFVAYDRLPADWDEDAPSPVPPDLAIEITSPDQTFGEMVAKATDYIAAGVTRVWVVDPRAKTVTVFVPDGPPQTYGQDGVVVDGPLGDLNLTVARIFQ